MDVRAREGVLGLELLLLLLRRRRRRLLLLLLLGELLLVLLRDLRHRRDTRLEGLLLLRLLMNSRWRGGKRYSRNHSRRRHRPRHVRIRINIWVGIARRIRRHRC